MIDLNKHIEINPDNPFLNCKLGREKYAESLEGILRTFQNGCVLAIDNEWGAGKTTFIKMWQQRLKNKKYEALYFNCWENDFDSNPLIAILSELKNLPFNEDKEKIKKVIKKGYALTKSIIPIVIRAIIEKHASVDKLVSEIAESISKDAIELFDAEIEEFTSKKKGLFDFRKELESFIAERNSKLPLVFFIDELDRCKPSYAVEVLEHIKHFFSVNGVIFILSIDKTQLCHSIRGYYGSDRIDAENYLKRFIDIEFNIPRPNSGNFCTFLSDKYKLDDFFNISERTSNTEFRYEKTDLVNISSAIFDIENLSLRKQEKLFLHTKIVLSQLTKNEYALPTLLFCLIYLKHHNQFFYSQIKERLINPILFFEEFEKFCENYNLKIKPKEFSFLIALALISYSNYYTEMDYSFSLYETEHSTKQIRIKPTLLSKDQLQESIEIISRMNLNFSINFYLERIEMLEQIKY
jgi:hypothetical protein